MGGIIPAHILNHGVFMVNTLVLEFETISVKDRKYKVGKLSIRQILRLTKFIAIFVNSLNAETKKQLKEGKSEVSDLLLFFEHLDETQLSKVIGIFINEDDTEFIKQNIDENVIDTNFLLDIARIVCEKTDIKGLLKKVKGVAEAIKK